MPNGLQVNKSSILDFSSVRGRPINAVFAQGSFDSAIAQWRVVSHQLRSKVPNLSELRDGAEADVLAYMIFPKAHRTHIRSTNPLVRWRGSTPK